MRLYVGWIFRDFGQLILQLHKDTSRNHKKFAFDDTPAGAILLAQHITKKLKTDQWHLEDYFFLGYRIYINIDYHGEIQDGKPE